MQMPREYIVDLHKFLYQSADSNKDTLVSRVLKHLDFIPDGTLYRYRNPSEREFISLKEKHIWLADPKEYPDVFDSTIPIDRDALLFDCPLYLMAEIMHRVMQDSAEERESAKNIIQSVKRIIQTQTPEEIHEKSVAILGDGCTMPPDQAEKISSTRPGYSDFMYDMIEINGKMMD